MMQSAGLGNCVNALASLAIPYRIPLPIRTDTSAAAGRPPRSPVCIKNRFMEALQEWSAPI